MRNFFFALSLLLTACGYHVGDGTVASRYRTISIPFVEGDIHGVMTDDLVRSISTRGCLSFVTCGGELALQVCLLPPVSDNIGFRYAEENGSLTKITTAVETRLTLTARVSLVDVRMGCTVIGPLEITAYQTFDFDTDFSTNNDHRFALGQLEMYNQAEDIAFRPLYAKLAQKIVDAVCFGW